MSTDAVHIHAPSILQKKIGGIPLSIVGLIGAVIALGVAFKVKATRSAPVADATADPASGEATPSSVPEFTANPSQDLTGSIAQVVTQATTDTNDLWAQRAIPWLISGGASVQEAQSAITKYLAGDNLSNSEGGLRDKAVGQFGLPPEQLTAIGNVGLSTAQASRQGTPPLTHTVKGANDNTWQELALLYYGSSSSDYVTTLRAANPVLRATIIPPGTAVKIPAYHSPKYYKTLLPSETTYYVASKNPPATAAHIEELNPNLHWPVTKGTRVRVA